MLIIFSTESVWNKPWLSLTSEWKSLQTEFWMVKGPESHQGLPGATYLETIEEQASPGLRAVTLCQF